MKFLSYIDLFWFDCFHVTTVYQIDIYFCYVQYGCYEEIYRVLKPGQCFAAYEWCMTDSFDPSNQEHQKIKVGIQRA